MSVGVVSGCGYSGCGSYCSFWSPNIVPLCLDDVVATDMLYIEVLAHIENGECVMCGCVSECVVCDV